MNREQYILSKVAEEAVEVSKEALKAQQFGMQSSHPDEPSITNRDRIVAELNDLLACVFMLDPSIAFEIEHANSRQAAKVLKVSEYLVVSEQLGLTRP